jgi:hypothetical protein
VKAYTKLSITTQQIQEIIIECESLQATFLGCLTPIGFHNHGLDWIYHGLKLYLKYLRLKYMSKVWHFNDLLVIPSTNHTLCLL